MEIFDASFDIRELIPFVVGRGHCAHLGIKFEDTGPGWCTLTLPYDKRLAGDAETGIMASGPIFTLMDMASGMSIFSARQRFDYPRPAMPGATIYGRSECYRMTKSVAFVRGLAHDGDPDKPVAHIAGSFMFMDAT
jgi:acyl-coenzyme A thioesterase PaaI-like protein